MKTYGVTVPTGMFDYESVKERMFFAAEPIAKVGNGKVLRSVGDVALALKLVMSDSESKATFMHVTDDMLKSVGTTFEQIYEASKDIVKKNYPVLIKGMNEMMEEALGLPHADRKESMYVARCNSVNGAGIIFYDEFFEEAYEKVGENFFVIPSSVHEVLLVPESSGTSIKEFKEMIRDINNAEVAEDERLSYEVFYYDHEAKQFDVAEKIVRKDVA